jgi:cytochrome o ubiquinol oxidase subunit IV
MSHGHEDFDDDLAPGDEHSQVLAGVRGYAVGLILASGLTAVSFWVAGSHILWAPGIPIGLCVLAIAQMGIHLAFFLHITTGPDNTNNVLALAFGVLIVFLVVAGSMLIMAAMNGNMMPMPMPLQQAADFHM